MLQSLQARTRALLDPAPEDRTASRNRRYDLAIDPETGGEVVKRKGWDGRESHSGPTYNSDPFQQAMPWELEQRGLPVPENYGKYQFAHVADRLEGEAITKPITTRKYRDSSGPTPGEAKLKEMMAAKQDIKEGMQLSTGEELAAWVDAQITNAEQKAETASPSRRTKRLGKDIADGLAQGLEEGQPAVRAQSSRLTDAALPSAAETQSKVSKMDLGNKSIL